MFILLFPFIFWIWIRYLVSKDFLPFCRWSVHLFFLLLSRCFILSWSLICHLALFPKQLDPYKCFPMLTSCSIPPSFSSIVFWVLNYILSYIYSLLKFYMLFYFSWLHCIKKKTNNPPTVLNCKIVKGWNFMKKVLQILFLCSVLKVLNLWISLCLPILEWFS